MNYITYRNSIEIKLGNFIWAFNIQSTANRWSIVLIYWIHEGSNTRNRYINNIKSASIKNLWIARQDAISCLKIFEEEFDHFVENVNNGLTPDQKTQMKENIKKQIYKMKQISNSKHKKKLGHLKMKYNIPKINKENQRIPGVEKKKTTTRRFIKRRKYQKWKLLSIERFWQKYAL